MGAKLISQRSPRIFFAATGDGLKAGAKRNYQVLSPLDFLAEFTQHIPANTPIENALYYNQVYEELATR